MSIQNAQPKYFNLHTSGIGYLSDIREIKPKKRRCILGLSNCCSYRFFRFSGISFFDMNVSGEETVNLIKRCQEAVEAKKKSWFPL